MSHKSLLFCPDEKTARTVTQVLSELDFTVEPAPDTSAAVGKLGNERFDALVVDCHSEQDAALLFKAARDSNQNHSCLSVAVVEGQSGVAKAFRIGANLVLTKPINIEQSKSTLRVARGLLRKNDSKVAQSAPAESKTPPQALNIPRPPASVNPVNTWPTAAITPKPPAPAMRVAAMPPSALEVEPEPVQAPEPADVALLESLPEPWGQPRPAKRGAPTSAGPVSIAMGDLGAAVAPALEKPRGIQLKPAGVAPRVTSQPIVKESTFTTSEPAPLSDFSAPGGLDVYENRSAGTFLKIAGVAAVLCGAGLLGWKMHWLDAALALRHGQATPSAPVAQPAAPVTVAITPGDAAVPPQSDLPNETAGASSSGVVSNPAARTAPAREAAPEKIDVEELPMSPDAKAPKPAPLVVTPGKANNSPAPVETAPQPVAPPLEIASLDNSKSALAGIVASQAAIPRVAPHSVEVSQGVSQGLVLKKVTPIYPSLAWQARKEGMVQLLATISKEGFISDVKVLKGDSVFVRSATDAVRQWKYRPYLLNGQPVEIQTQITINFTIPR